MVNVVGSVGKNLADFKSNPMIQLLEIEVNIACDKAEGEKV